MATTHPSWALGFEDEVWWSRLARPALKSWGAADQPLRLVEQTVAKDDPDPKALACYGLLVRWAPPAGVEAEVGWHEEAWLRFVDGRPVSAVTTRYLAWCCAKLEAAGKEALLLVWDNASWHRSREVRRWRPVRGADRPVLFAEQEPVAEPDRTQMGARQAAGGRAGRSAHRARTGRPGLRGLRVCPRTSPEHFRLCRLIMH